VVRCQFPAKSIRDNRAGADYFAYAEIEVIGLDRIDHRMNHPFFTDSEYNRKIVAN
jgi:hypothetical protein